MAMEWYCHSSADSRARAHISGLLVSHKHTPYYTLYRKLGLHTLCLLDIKVKEPNLEMLARGKTVYEPPRYMSINTVGRGLGPGEDRVKATPLHEHQHGEAGTGKPSHQSLSCRVAILDCFLVLRVF